MEADSLRENRFITLEWNLLKEMKLQTDKQLLEKDNEIAELRQRYKQLEQSNASASKLQEMEIQLKKLEDERAKLIVETGKTNVQDEALKSIPLNDTKDTVSAFDITNLLLIRIDMLEAQLEEQRSSSATLEKELLDLDASDAGGQATAEKDTEAKAFKETLAKARADAMSALTELRQKKKKIDNAGSLSIDDLNAWTLLRALASSQAIKADYPDLLRSVESYFDAYGKQKVQDGQREAYAAAIKMIELLVKKLDGN
jgi:hypothetical protein